MLSRLDRRRGKGTPAAKVCNCKLPGNHHADTLRNHALEGEAHVLVGKNLSEVFVMRGSADALAVPIFRTLDEASRLSVMPPQVDGTSLSSMIPHSSAPWPLPLDQLFFEGDFVTIHFEDGETCAAQVRCRAGLESGALYNFLALVPTKSAAIRDRIRLLLKDRGMFGRAPTESLLLHCNPTPLAAKKAVQIERNGASPVLVGEMHRTLEELNAARASSQREVSLRERAVAMMRVYYTLAGEDSKDGKMFKEYGDNVQCFIKDQARKMRVARAKAERERDPEGTRRRKCRVRRPVRSLKERASAIAEKLIANGNKKAQQRAIEKALIKAADRIIHVVREEEAAFKLVLDEVLHEEICANLRDVRAEDARMDEAAKGPLPVLSDSEDSDGEV